VAGSNAVRDKMNFIEAGVNHQALLQHQVELTVLSPASEYPVENVWFCRCCKNVLFRYANPFIICLARCSSISSCLGTGCFFTCFRINIKIVTAAMPYKLAAGGSDFLNKFLSLHRLKASSLTVL